MSGDYSVHLAEGDREKALWDDKLTQLVTHYDELLTRHDGTVAWVALMDAIKDVEPWKVNATLAAAVHRIAGVVMTVDSPSRVGAVYVAGPMTGIAEFNYPMFNMVAAELRRRGRTVHNPAENDGGSSDQPWAFYMRLAIKQLIECEEVCLLPGWRNSKGARIEVALARDLGMTVWEWGS